jgi:hypothetical protein
MIEILVIIFGIPFLFAGGAALLLDWCWPALGERPLGWIATGISTFGIIGWSAWVISDMNAHPSGSPDDAGFIIMGLMLFVMIGLPIGILASRLTVRYLRGEYRGKR